MTILLFFKTTVDSLFKKTYRSNINKPDPEARRAADSRYVDSPNPRERVEDHRVDGGQQSHGRPHAQHRHHQEEQHCE